MIDFPRSRIHFQRRFPDEAACAAWLLERVFCSLSAVEEHGAVVQNPAASHEGLIVSLAHA